MTNTVSRRGVLVGGAAVSAASCASMQNVSEDPSSETNPTISEYTKTIQQNAKLTELGMLLVSHLMHSAYNRYDRGERPTNGKYTIPLRLKVTAPRAANHTQDAALSLPRHSNSAASPESQFSIIPASYQTDLAANGPTTQACCAEFYVVIDEAIAGVEGQPGQGQGGGKRLKPEGCQYCR